jgi:hypothetical protein
VQLVGHRPDEDALHAGLREGHEFLGEQLGGTDRETFAKRLLGPMHGGNHSLCENAVGLGGVVGDVHHIVESAFGNVSAAFP